MGKASRKKHPRTPLPKHLEGRPVSAALIDMVAPLYEEDMPIEAYRFLVDFAAVAWNIAQFPKERRQERLRAFFQIRGEALLSFNEIVTLSSGAEVTAEPSRGMNLVELVKAFIHRKDRLFPDDPRWLVRWEVSWKNDQFHVSAASSLPSAETLAELTAP